MTLDVRLENDWRHAENVVDLLRDSDIGDTTVLDKKVQMNSYLNKFILAASVTTKLSTTGKSVFWQCLLLLKVSKEIECCMKILPIFASWTKRKLLRRARSSRRMPFSWLKCFRLGLLMNSFGMSFIEELETTPIFASVFERIDNDGCLIQEREKTIARGGW